MKSFDDTWRAWIARNLEEGCSKDLLFKLLHDDGFAYDAIRQELDHEPVVGLGTIFNPLARQEEAHREGQTRSGFSHLLEEGPPLDPPDWLDEAEREQQALVPFLNAGDALCRGFEKRRLAPDVFREVQRRYSLLKPFVEPEQGDAIGNFVKTADPFLPPTLLAMDADFNATLLELMQPLHEEWCGFPLEPSACYGFRIYLNGAYLHDHVDRRNSHVISSTLCVDRHLFAPWPLHAIDADGVEHQVETEPGEFVLYESARIRHGRPVPMNGRFHAALFLHYRPAEDWDLWVESPQAWFDAHGPFDR